MGKMLDDVVEIPGGSTARVLPFNALSGSLNILPPGAARKLHILHQLRRLLYCDGNRGGNTPHANMHPEMGWMNCPVY